MMEVVATVVLVLAGALATLMFAAATGQGLSDHPNLRSAEKAHDERLALNTCQVGIVILTLITACAIWGVWR